MPGNRRDRGRRRAKPKSPRMRSSMACWRGRRCSRGKIRRNLPSTASSCSRNWAPRALEATVAERIVGLSWRLQRTARSQNAAFETLYDKQAAWAPKGSADLGPGAAADNGPILGQMLVTDFANTRVLERLLVYERRIEGSLLRMMAELRRLRRERASGAGVAEQISREDWGCFRQPSRTSYPAAGDLSDDTLLAHPPTLAETPHDATSNTPAIASCETKPISEGASCLKCQVSSEASRAWHPPASNFTLQTSNSAVSGLSRTASRHHYRNARGGEASVRNKANCARFPCKPSILMVQRL